MAYTTILLASASPRRRELMRILNVPFGVLSTDIDETPRPDETAAELVARLSRAKAEAARRQTASATVIACDTTVELDGRLFGKPSDKAEARAMLQELRGRRHSVLGSITILSGNNIETIITHTRVRMRNYSDEEIEAYIATGDPLDKAAAYGVQNSAFHPVEGVDGCFANVMGLALCHLHNALARRITLPRPCLECQQHPNLDCTIRRLVEEGSIAAA